MIDPFLGILFFLPREITIDPGPGSLLPDGHPHTIHKCDGDVISVKGYMAGLCIIPDPEYRGKGISEGLARGLLIFASGENLTGEGMGIGSVAIRDGNDTSFSRSWTDTGDIRTGLTRTFSIDTDMKWSIRGRVSPLLTSLIESAISTYMRLPRLQAILMGPVMPLRNLFSIHPYFVPVPPKAEVRFTYIVIEQGISVRVSVHPLTPPCGTICILNELAGDRFISGWLDGKIVPPPPGWESIPPRFPTPSLADPGHGVRFWIQGITPADLPVSLYWGREEGGDLSWAGFSIEIGLPESDQDFTMEYLVGIEGTREGIPF
jgi:hypothetical protein